MIANKTITPRNIGTPNLTPRMRLSAKKFIQIEEQLMQANNPYLSTEDKPLLNLH